MKLIAAHGAPASPARLTAATRPPLRVGLVQHAWRADPAALADHLVEAIGQAARDGAQLVCLPEITLLRYPAAVRATGRPGDAAEELTTGPTFAMASRAARAHGVFVHASVYRRVDAEDGLGLNTAFLVSPAGDLVGVTDKLHIPVGTGYHEDTYFRPGAAEAAYPVHRPAGLDVALGLPTCWDEWFPELARAYSLLGAEVLIYPTAIGSEPALPDFDTQPIWRQVIVANGITAGTFMVVPNRVGDEGELTFFGSSFISDPYGRVLIEAPRDEEAVLVADLDLDQRRDWQRLFDFQRTRRPDAYGVLTEPVGAAPEPDPRLA